MLKKAEALKMPTILVFRRKIDVSNAFFTAGLWEDRAEASNWPPVKIREMTVRGTFGNRLKSAGPEDAEKIGAKLENANLQTIDLAYLSPAQDTLKVSFSLRFLSGVGQPSACNVEPYRLKLAESVARYHKVNGFKELARRYALNLANGRFLWRNRLGAQTVEIRVKRMGEDKGSWLFKALDYSLFSFAIPEAIDSQIEELAGIIEKGLSGGDSALFQVCALARLGRGQEVYPSQEMFLDKGDLKKSKILFRLEDGTGLHAQKINNAIRTIDDWYPEAEQYGPIPVEPYGSVSTLARAFRGPGSRLDFFTLLDNWLLKNKIPALEKQHFIMAVLIRGGVFGGKGGDHE